MSRGQEKIFSTLGPKLSGSKAQQYYGDKPRQIRLEPIDYGIGVDLSRMRIYCSEKVIYDNNHKHSLQALQKLSKHFAPIWHATEP